MLYWAVTDFPKPSPTMKYVVPPKANQGQFVPLTPRQQR
jgi:hypothetical protein